MIFCIQSAAACTLVCNNNVTVAINSTGSALITPAMIMEGGGTTCTNLSVEVFVNGNPIGNTIDCSHVGMTLTAHLIDLNTNNYCASSISIVDGLDPVLDCPDVFILCNAPSHPDSIGYPIATDNCTIFANEDLTYTENVVDLPCFDSYGGNVVTARIDRTWTAVDDAGNVTTCVQKIFRLRSYLSAVVFPPNRDGFAAPKLTCSIDDPNDLNDAGQPLIGGRPIDNAGLCEILIYHSDQTFPLCGGGTRILRAWTAFDVCTNAQEDMVQIIDTEDAIAPTISCPADVTLSTDPNECTATVLLPTATATDECSNVTIIPTWAFGSGIGPHSNVPVGTHLVTYTATDDCGNTAQCTINVNIEDTSPPTAVCENTLSVSLLPDGTARIYASVFDEGTNDNCAIDRFEVSRDGLPFGDYVDFSCGDVNNPVTVQFRAYDVYGLTNDCWVTVNANDNFAPSISCPANLSINCDDDPDDLNLVGQATANDPCGLDTLYFVDDVNVNCGNGTITREWIAKDLTGNSSSCTQIITVQDNNNFVVNFPPDVTIDLCSNSTNPSNTGEPLITGESCRNINVTHTDQTFTSAIYCYTIIRSWIVIDWCEYDPNSGSTNGYYTHDQLIEVFDNSLPTISCPSDMIALDTSSTCNGVFVNIPIANTVDCDPNVTITNNSPYASAAGEDASGFYPHGVHTVEFTAEDNCGNTASCSTVIEVKDGKAPTVICLSGVSASISSGGSIIVTAAMVVGNAYDNCSATQDLTYTIIPNIFDCDDIGLQNITVTATDEAGNVGNCNAIIDIQDNNGYCSGAVMIGGKVSKENNTEMMDIEMMLSGNQTGMIQTDLYGDYDFSTLASGANYTITPQRDNYHSNGVTTYDIVVIQQHILGIAALSSPYKMIAADANNSGSITTFDIIQIRQLIIGVIGNFPANESWRFVASDFVFPNPSNPWQTSFPEFKSFVALNNNEMDVDFVAVKIGDVNNSASANSLGNESQDRSIGEALNLKLEEQFFEKGEELYIEFKADEFIDIMSIQFATSFDISVLEFVEVSNYDLAGLTIDNFGLNQVDKGILKVSWDEISGLNLAKESPLFTLKFKTKKGGLLSEVFILDRKHLINEVYDLDHIEAHVALVYQEKINEIPTSVEEQVFGDYVGQNYPNPVKSETRIPITVSKQSTIDISIFDSQGKLLNQKFYELVEGEHEILWTKEDLKIEEGLLIYTVKINDEITISKKMFLTN